MNAREFLRLFPDTETDVSTGGGCACWNLVLPDGRSVMLTEWEGSYDGQPTDETVTCTVGLYSAAGEWDEELRSMDWAHLARFVHGLMDDGIDYRAMFAIEVRKERAWRIEGRALKPADMIGVQGYFDGANRNLREVVERNNGEPLA